jgi:hypothetical protein
VHCHHGAQLHAALWQGKAGVPAHALGLAKGCGLDHGGSCYRANQRYTANGDVFVSGIPMVDQGQKGYCVVASCQRMFEYLHVPCDQHELAQLAQSSATGGTSPSLMEEALDKVDHKYQTRLKRLITPMDRRKTTMDTRKFSDVVKESVDAGIPLLWALTLGKYQEEPPLSEQTMGGHMRMIIGYNEKDGALIFSDSWGAGHEKKRMKLHEGLAATHGLYQLVPKSL